MGVKSFPSPGGAKDSTLINVCASREKIAIGKKGAPERGPSLNIVYNAPGERRMDIPKASATRRREVQAAIKRARVWQNRMSPGLWKDAMGALIDQAQSALPEE